MCGDCFVFLENIEQVKKKIKLDELVTESKQILQSEGLLYDLVENALKDSVGVFESYCKNSYVKYKMMQQLQLDKSKFLRDIGNSFQNIEKTKLIFRNEFAIDITSFIS